MQYSFDNGVVKVYNENQIIIEQFKNPTLDSFFNSAEEAVEWVKYTLSADFNKKIIEISLIETREDSAKKIIKINKKDFLEDNFTLVFHNAVENSREYFSIDTEYTKEIDMDDNYSILVEDDSYLIIYTT